MSRESPVRPTLSELAGALRDDAGRLAVRVGERVARDVPEWLAERPEFSRRAFRLARSSIESQLGSLAAGGRFPREAPQADLEFGAIAAQQEVPLHVVLDTYRRGHAVLWEEWFALVERSEAGPEAQRRLLHDASQFFFAYAAWVTEAVAGAYAAARDALESSAEQQRLHLVREALDGGEVDLAGIGYDLGGNHLGLVAWGEAAEDAARALAQLLGRRLLFVEVFDGTGWGWAGGARSLDAGQRERLAGFAPPRGTQIAIGVEAAGHEGFRQTHADAKQAQRAAWTGGRPVTRYDDIALEALAAADERAARRFVARELRGLDDDDERSQRLRETLTVYFARGANAAATAKALGIHEQTVAQRLTAVEERTGRAVVARRAELETALRLRRYFAGLVSRS